MGDDRLVITEAGFLTEFFNQHTQRTERPFCFILGAGVSRASEISTGAEMASVWLREIYEAENFGGLSLEEWATSAQLGIEQFNMSSLASFYPQLYRRKFGDNEQSGFAFLESQMEGKEPSYGYSVLSYLLSETLHRVVITTNFDNLVADALSIHSNRFPLVIGHDALAQYATVELRRPLIAKIHGALGFSPKSKPDEISQLPKGWCDALRRILDRYTPIVIGYEGNDGSLMGFLKELPPDVPDRVFWCVYAPDARGVDFVQLVSQEVRDYVRSRRGRFVPIGGFDELMAKLFRKLGEKGSVPDLYENLKERARKREQSYDEQQRKLFEAAIPSKSDGKDKLEPSTRGKVDRALSEAVSGIAESRKEKPWWVWVNEADAERDVAAKEDIYRRALQALPNDPDVLRNYAGFFERDSKDLDQAESCYLRSLEAAPNNPTTLAFYADFLNRLRKEPDKAEDYFQLALNSEPANPYAVTEYAKFLTRVRNSPDRAEDVYVRAIATRPGNRRILTSYEHFLRNTRKDPAKADKIKSDLEAFK